MTHGELLIAVSTKLGITSGPDMKILTGLISGIALKGDSLFEFYKEMTLSGDYLSLATVRKYADKYSVPRIYRTHIEERFITFKDNLVLVCEQMNKGELEHTDPEKWKRNGEMIFGSTELETISMADGLDVICKNMLTLGYFDYLEGLFKKSATEISKIKYASLMGNSTKSIGYKQ